MNILSIFITFLVVGYLTTIVVGNIFSAYAVIKHCDEAMNLMFEAINEHPDVNVFRLAMPIVHEFTKMEIDELTKKIENIFINKD